MGRPAAGISRDAREWLLSYPWPGNVRELRNAIERAILLCDGGLITREHLPRPPVPLATGHGHGNGAGNGLARTATNHSPNGAAPLPPEAMNLGTVERGLVEKALGQAKGNKSQAARLLGLSRAQLYWRLEKYGIQ